MSGNSAQGFVNFLNLTHSIKNELNHLLIPTDNKSDEDADDFSPAKRYIIQAGDICVVKQDNGFGKICVCVFVTKCYVIISDDDNDDDDDKKEARVSWQRYGTNNSIKK